MHRHTKLRDGSSLPKVIRCENSVLVHHGRQQPYARPSVSRHRDDVQTPDASEQQLEDDVIINPARPDPILPPKSRSDLDRSGMTCGAGYVTKIRQLNMAGKRSCLPLAQWLFDVLLQDIVREVTVATLQGCIRGFVDTFLAEMTIQRCAADIIYEMVQCLLHGLVEELQREKPLDDVIEAEMLPEVLVEESRAVALSELARCESQVIIQQLCKVHSPVHDTFLNALYGMHLLIA